jgi:hypothetical protein
VSEPAVETQQIIFANRVIPDLFHSTPDSFQFLINRDGTKFLRFYWDEAGKKLNPDQLKDAFGLNYFIRKPNARSTVIILSLPEPSFPGEAYYIALIHRPYRQLLMVSDTTTIFTLERSEPQGEDPPTTLVEWSHRLQRYEVRRGIPPGLEEFYEAVVVEMAE